MKKHNLPVPGIIIDDPLEVEDTLYEGYCNLVNSIICDMAMNSAESICQQGNGPEETIFVYEDLNIRLKFISSKYYGKDRFTVEINRRVWEELTDVSDKIRSLVRDTEDWILVYGYSDSFDRLEYHLPGWLNVLTQLDQ